MDRAAKHGQRIDAWIKGVFHKYACSLNQTAVDLSIPPDDIAFIVDPQKLKKPGWDCSKCKKP